MTAAAMVPPSTAPADFEGGENAAPIQTHLDLQPDPDVVAANWHCCATVALLPPFRGTPLHFCLSACLPARLPACLPACLPSPSAAMPLSALPTPGHSSESFVAMTQLSATSCEFDAAIRFSQETNSNRHFIPGVPAERNTNSRQPLPRGSGGASTRSDSFILGSPSPRRGGGGGGTSLPQVAALGGGPAAAQAAAVRAVLSPPNVAENEGDHSPPSSPFSSLAALPAEEEYIGVDLAAGTADAIADGEISCLHAPPACPAPPEGARLSATTTTTAGAGAAAGREREDGSLATLIINY